MEIYHEITAQIRIMPEKFNQSGTEYHEVKFCVPSSILSDTDTIRNIAWSLGNAIDNPQGKRVDVLKITDRKLPMFYDDEIATQAQKETLKATLVYVARLKNALRMCKVTIHSVLEILLSSASRDHRAKNENIMIACNSLVARFSEIENLLDTKTIEASDNADIPF